jgi:hypothetical protein
MILYQFAYSDGKIYIKQCEAEEKPKTYRVFYGYGTTSIKKTDLDRVDRIGFCMWSLSSDVEPFKKELRRKKLERIATEEARIRGSKSRIEQEQEYIAKVDSFEVVMDD